MKRLQWWLVGGIAMLLIAVLAFPADAQLGGLKRRVKQKVEDKAAEKAEKAIDNATEGESEEAEKEDAENTEAKESSGTKEDAGTASGDASGQKLGEGVWLKYDFVPGDRVLFLDDLTRDEVGNFPQRLELAKGNMEVAEWKGSRWLRTPTYADFSIALPEVLPDRFTIEFDFYCPEHWPEVAVRCEVADKPQDANFDEVFFTTWGQSAGIRRESSKAEVSMTRLAEGVIDAVMHCRVMADGKYMKVYVNDTRVANFPNTNYPRSNKLVFEVAAQDERPAMFANFRIAASDKKMYDALMAKGRVATQGIFFDSGSDRVRPESTPTLKLISQMLKDHADLRLLIEGHTDNTGDKAGNQTLSEKRAAAVLAALTGQFGIDGSRLESKGFGDTKPASSNDTPEGRQNNRRVELVKL